MIAGFLKTRIDYESEIESLEDKLRLKDCEIERLTNDLNVYRQHFAELTKLIDGTPSDCTRGEWCEACGFSKRYVFIDPFYHETVYCKRGASCKNFIQKEK